MKVSTDKSHLLLSGNTKLASNFNNNTIESEMKQELLGITINSNLSFEEHINNICKMANQELDALARISSYYYCPLVWMFCRRKLNNKINAIHERALRIAYCDKHSTFQQLLEKDNSISTHHRNLQVLWTGMFKVNMNLSPDLVNNIFVKEQIEIFYEEMTYFLNRQVSSVYNGTESLSFLGPKRWEVVPSEIKQSESLETFKRRIKKWIVFQCPCRLYQIYLPGVGFI